MSVDDLIREQAASGARRRGRGSTTVDASTGRVTQGAHVLAEGVDSDPIRRMYEQKKHGERATEPDAPAEEEPAPDRPRGDIGSGPRGTPVESRPSFDDVLRAARDHDPELNDIARKAGLAGQVVSR